MTLFEALSVGIAILALIVSTYSWFSSRDIGQKQIDLQRYTAYLSKKHLEMLMAEEAESNSAKLSFQAVTENRKHKFVLQNTGNVAAKNVSFELCPQGRGESPIVESDYSRKFPIPEFAPGSIIRVLAALHLGSATAFEVKLRWQDPNERQREESTLVSS